MRPPRNDDGPAGPGGGAPPPRERARRRPPAGGGGGRPALPKRVRQENLAAQLREEPGGAAPEPTGPTGPDRSPEELRSMMSAIQQGTRRGRAESVEYDEGS